MSIQPVQQAFQQQRMPTHNTPEERSAYTVLVSAQRTLTRLLTLCQLTCFYSHLHLCFLPVSLSFLQIFTTLYKQLIGVFLQLDKMDASARSKAEMAQKIAQELLKSSSHRLGTASQFMPALNSEQSNIVRAAQQKAAEIAVQANPLSLYLCL